MSKIIRKKRIYEGKDGKEHYSYNYYVQVGNGLVAIQPVFKEDAKLLYFCSEEVQD